MSTHRLFSPALRAVLLPMAGKGGRLYAAVQRSAGIFFGPA